MKLFEWSLTSYKWMCCIVLALSAISSTVNYYSNKGKVSSVDYRIFHQAELDKYPSFSICVEMENTPSSTSTNENNSTFPGPSLFNFTSIYNNGDIINNWSINDDSLVKSEINQKEDTRIIGQKIIVYFPF